MTFVLLEILGTLAGPTALWRSRRRVGGSGRALLRPPPKPVLYTWKVRALKSPVLNYWWRYWRAWRGRNVGNYDQLPQHIRKFAVGRSFVDVGCMWGVDGEYAFQAEAAGAARVTAVDVFGPTPEFQRKKGSIC